MSSDNGVTYLRDLIDINPKIGIQKGKLYPFVDMAAVQEWQRDIPLEKLSSREFQGSGSRFEGGDILLARITPCFENGKTAVAPTLPEPAHGSTEFIVVRSKRKEDHAYVYGLLRTSDFRDFAIKQMVGTSGRQRIPNEALLSYELPIPDDAYRAKASKILGGIDDLCSSLRAEITALESIAQTLFRSWFIRFDPVRAKAAGLPPEAMSPELAALFTSEFEDTALGPIPKGWSATTFGEAFHVNPRRSIPKASVAPHLEMANVATKGHRPAHRLPHRSFGSGTKYINGDTLLARITPCLENGKTAFVDFLMPNQVGWGSTEFIVLRSKEGYPLLWSYLVARQEQFRAFAIKAMTGTSGRQRVDVSSLQTYGIAMPPIELAEAVAPVFDSIQHQMTVNAEVAMTLSELRDHLLPRLISGKLSLVEAQAAVEELLPA